MTDTCRGAIVIQIDGLSHEMLSRALRLRMIPGIRRLLRKRGYLMRRFRSGLPATTPGVHAKAFFGDTHLVPGFDWFDRASRQMRSMSNPADVRELEDRLARHHPGALEGGSAYGTFFRAGASRSAFVASATEIGHLMTTLPPFEYFEFLVSSAGALWRMFARAAYELLIEVWDYARETVTRTPRLAETAFLFERIGANAVMREVVTSAVSLDIRKGVPLIWANYPQYDVMAHHRGPESIRALLTLRGIDACIRRIEREARRAHAREYDIYLMSDHGQTPAIPFDRVHGTTFEHWLRQRVIQSASVAASVGGVRGPLPSDAPSEPLSIVRGIRPHLRWPFSRLARLFESRLVRDRARNRRDPLAERVEKVAGSIHTGSTGGMTGVYLDPGGVQLSVDEIRTRYPGLLESIVSLDGVAAVAARGDRHEVVLVSSCGSAVLTAADEAARVEGTDPLSGFPDPARARTDIEMLMSMRDAGDMVIFSGRVSGHRRKKPVLNFRQQFGAHGGLSGPEQNAFVIGPAAQRDRIEAIREPQDFYTLLRSYRNR